MEGFILSDTNEAADFRSESNISSHGQCSTAWEILATQLIASACN